MLAGDAEDAAGNAQAVREADGGSRFAPDGPRHLHRALVLDASGGLVVMRIFPALTMGFTVPVPYIVGTHTV